MPVWYPSKKMQCIIKAESTKVEFPFLLTAEHDDDVLEVGISPRPFPWNISTSMVISNDQCIPQTTLSSAIANVDGWSANLLKNCSSKLRSVPIGTCSMSMVSGDALLAKPLPRSMD